MEGAAPSRRGGVKSRRSRSFSGLWGGYPSIYQGPRGILGKAEDEEGEESEEMEGEAALAGAPEACVPTNEANSNQPLASQAEPNFLRRMKQMTQFIGQLTPAVTPRDNYKAPAFKTPSMKEHDPYDGRKFANKLLFSLVELENGLSPTSNLSNEAPSYLLNNWKWFETQLFTLFGDPNEVRKAQQEFENLRMKESAHVSLYIAYFRSLMSRVGDWGERAYICVYTRGFESILLDQLASHPCTFYNLQELMNIPLELDTRYHERQKEKGGNQEKKPPVTGSNFSRHPKDLPSKMPHQKKNKKAKKFQVLKDKPHAALLNKDNKLIGSEKERRIKEGLCTYCGVEHPIEKCFKRPHNNPESSRGFPRKQGKALVGIMICSMLLTYFLQEHNCAL
ncbi:hypothetical protein O181_008140 [Austropuccinia psidii MF-1]|uniref:Retrotransposon gag domain-containing protein n=1 Tax=Austropuccinia psidii MF-1 TaxID=1389203 RepID=A0A9Q3BNR8_9BASI|nr:hypothetical protein [Austropuccinia psidii MF-1]